MRFTARLSLATVVALLVATGALRAQAIIPDSVRRAVGTAAAPARVLEIQRDASGVIRVELETDELTFDRMLHKEWPFSLGQEHGPLTTEQGGRVIADAIWTRVFRNGVQSIQVVVRSMNAQDDPTRVRLSYSRSELMMPARSGLTRSD